MGDSRSSFEENQMAESIKIKSIRAIPLYGKAYDDWPHRFGDLEQTRTLVEVLTDNGLASLGSIYTSGPLVEGALKYLRPLYEGASAIDPAATSERLHQNTFWQGRGGSVEHAISGLDIPRRSHQSGRECECPCSHQAVCIDANG